MGLILAFYGGGKGKTTSALGVVLRAWGHGLRILYAAVMKTPFYMGEEVGEFRALRRLGVDVISLADAHSPGEVLREAVSEADNYDLVVLDELLYAVRQGYISSRDLLMLRNLKPHVVVTGNFWVPEVGSVSDLITRMVDERHYSRRGYRGVRGLDW